MPGDRLTLGRYEVTVGEYRVVALATEAGADNCSFSGSWQDPALPQTDRHPVVCVNWDDA